LIMWAKLFSLPVQRKYISVIPFFKHKSLFQCFTPIKAHLNLGEILYLFMGDDIVGERVFNELPLKE